MLRTVDSDGGDGAGVDEAGDAGAKRGIEKVARAGDVALVNLLGIAGPKPVVGGDVKDAVDCVDGASERGCVAQVALDAFDVKAGERGSLALRAGQDSNGVASGDQTACDVTTDEAVGARNERLHRMRKTS